MSAFCEVAQTRQAVSLSDASVRFIGTVPNLDPVRLAAAVRAHAEARKTMVMVSSVGNRLILELESQRPVRLERKIIKTINEAARSQFTGGEPRRDLDPHLLFRRQVVLVSLVPQRKARPVSLMG